MIIRGTVDVSSKAVSSVTTVTGMAVAPVAIIFLARLNSATPANVSGSLGSDADGHTVGVLTAGGQFGLCSVRDSGGSDVGRQHASGIVHDGTLGVPSGNRGKFVGALTSDGFTLTCTDATSTNNHLHYIAIGGTGVSAEVGVLTAPSSPSTVDHNLGIKPHMLLHWSLGTIENSSDGVYHIAMGCVAYDLTQASASLSEGSSHIEYTTDEEGFSYNQANTASLLARGVAEAWTSNGVRINWAAASSQKFHYLALRGITTQLVSQITDATLAGVSTVSGMPWQPDAGIAFSTMRNGGFHTPGTPTATTGTARIARLSVGWWDSPSDHMFVSFTAYVLSTGFLGCETRYGSDNIAGFRTQLTGTPGVLYDLTAVNSDGFDITTTSITGGSAAARPLLTLAFLDRAPRENIFPPPHIGAP